MYGAHIRAARERAGLTPAEAARRVGYDSPDMIYKIEKDKANASLEMLDRLADAFGMSVGDLLPNSGAGPVSDRFAPIMAAMVGLDERAIDELILNLAGQARIMAGWRRRDGQAQPLQTNPSVPVYTPMPTQTGDRPSPPLRDDDDPAQAWENDGRTARRHREDGAPPPKGHRR